VRWIVGGRVLNPEAGSFERLDIAVEGERIVALEPPGHAAAADDRVVVDGLFLIPGLIDCHVHLVMRGEDADPAASAARSDDEIAGFASEAAERTLLGGVTSVRDVGGWNHVEMGVRSAVEAGRRLGPRMFLAGRLLSVPTPAVGYYPGMYEVASGPEQVRAAARREFDRGADLIKVMATGAMLSPVDEDARAQQFGPAELRAAVEEARAHGSHVAAHAHAVEGSRDAVQAGVASIEHGTYADEAALRRMAERGTFLVATNSVFSTALLDQGFLASMPPHIQARYVDNDRIHRDAMTLAHRLGVPMAMGTDAGAPGDHHGRNAQECVLLVEENGLSPLEAVAAATVNAARLLRRERDIGSLTTGRFADVVGFRANPLQDIRAVLQPVFVAKGGVVVVDEPGQTGARSDS
jgi:imidazolonepropionase-like amidohydrolase